MDVSVWLSFAAASTLLLLIPGPTILTVLGYSLHYGARANLPLIAAVALGDGSAMLLSVLGLGALLAVSAFWFALFKYAGAVYLLWLGVNMWRQRHAISLAATNKRPVLSSPATLFINTYLVTLLNPKGIIFFAAFLPQFIDPQQALTSQFLLLGSTFVTLAIIVTSAYALTASTMSRHLGSSRAQHRFSIVGGSGLVLAACWLLFSERGKT